MNHFSISLCLLVASSMAIADTTLVYTSVSDGDKEAARMRVKNGQIIMKAGSGDDAIRMLFQEDKDRFVIIDDDKRTYMIFDRKTINQIANMQKRVMEQMEAQLSQLPPEQREQMRRMMENMSGDMMPARPEPRRIEHTGQSDNVAGRECEQVEIYSGERIVARQCLVDIDVLEIPAEDFGTIVAMQRFMMDLADNFAAVQDEMFEFGDPEQEQIPVRFEHVARTAGETRGELTELSMDAIDAAEFTIPSDYKQEKLPNLEPF